MPIENVIKFPDRFDAVDDSLPTVSYSNGFLHVGIGETRLRMSLYEASALRAELNVKLSAVAHLQQNM